MYIIMIITILVKFYFVPNENIPVYRKWIFFTERAWKMMSLVWMNNKYKHDYIKSVGKYYASLKDFFFLKKKA